MFAIRSEGKTLIGGWATGKVSCYIGDGWSLGCEELEGEVGIWLATTEGGVYFYRGKLKYWPMSGSLEFDGEFCVEGEPVVEYKERYDDLEIVLDDYLVRLYLPIHEEDILLATLRKS